MIMAQKKRRAGNEARYDQRRGRRTRDIGRQRPDGRRVGDSLRICVQPRICDDREESCREREAPRQPDPQAGEERECRAGGDHRARDRSFPRELVTSEPEGEVREAGLQGKARFDEVAHGPVTAQHLGGPRHVHEVIVLEVEREPAKQERRAEDAGGQPHGWKAGHDVERKARHPCEPLVVARRTRRFAHFVRRQRRTRCGPAPWGRLDSGHGVE